MTRIVFGFVAILSAACSTTPAKPRTPAELLPGAWTCETKSGPVTINAAMTYSPDGKAAGEINVAGGGNPSIAATGKIDGSWKLLENDTRLEQTVTNVTITSAKLNDQTIEPAMAQAMIGSSLAGQSSVTAIQVDDKTLTLTDTSGAVTSCTR